MKTFLSAFGGAIAGGAIVGAVAYQMLKKGAIQVTVVPPKSRELEEISPKFKADEDREIAEIEADYEPYRTPTERALELRAILNELLAGPVTEHEAKKIAHTIGAQIEILALKAERTIKEFQPKGLNEDEEQL